jgi:hypothetical protein
VPGSSGRDHLEREVVIVSTEFTDSHGISLRR